MIKDTTPYPFQVADVRRIRDLDGRVLLANEVGLGKTFESLLYAWKFLPNDPPRPIICVVPSHLKINWKREAEKHLGIRVEILEHLQVTEGKLPPINPRQVYVVNYEILVPRHWPHKTDLPEGCWAHWLRSLNPNLIILDEGHYIKNPSSGRTVAVRKLCRGVPHILILTGTPLPNKPVDLWSPLHILDPERWKSHFDFCMRYTNAKKRFWGWEFKGAKNLDSLHEELLQNYMIRRRKEDVLTQLPTIRHNVVNLDVDLTSYNAAEYDYVDWLERRFPKLQRSQAEARNRAKLMGLKQLIGELKVDAVSSWIKDFVSSSDTKLLVGVHHYAMSDPLMEELGKSALLVDGRIDANRKQDRFDAFNNNKKYRVMVGNLDAAGTGWSCRSASNVAIAEFPWVPGALEQFVGRIHGIERGEPGTAAQVWHLVVPDSVDEDICDILQMKLKWSRRAIDGHTGEVWADIYREARGRITSRVKGESLIP